MGASVLVSVAALVWVELRPTHFDVEMILAVSLCSRGRDILRELGQGWDGSAL